MPSRRAADPLVMALIATIYVVAAKLGLKLAVVHASVTVVWPPTGIALAALLLLGYRFWPAIFIGAFVANVTTAGSVATSLGIATGNTLEALTGAWLITRFASGRQAFVRVQDVLKFVVLGAMLSTIVSATFGAASLALGGLADWSSFGSIWLTWWLGDATGALLVAPPLILWANDPKVRWSGSRILEAMLLVLSLAAVGQLVFGALLPSQAPDYPVDFLAVPPLVWAAFRFGPRETAAATVALASMALWSTLHGLGPFVRSEQNESLILLQAFMGLSAIFALAFATLVAERKRVEEERLILLREARAISEEAQRGRAAEAGARAEAEAANRVKDEFLAMLGHELRNPLGAISSAAQVLDRVEAQGESAKHARRIITRQVKHLSGLIDDLLDVGQVMSGKIVLDLQPLDLYEAVAHALDTLRTAGRVADHAVTLEGERVWIHADATRLEQVVINLVGNALKHTLAGGSIRIGVSRAGARAVLRVQDTGMGIPGELLPRIFDLFVQGERRLDRTRGGLGIGLTVVRRLVERHHGTVEAASDGSGKGSLFTVSFPAIAARIPVEGQHQAVTPVPSRRIVIVEDNADSRAMLRALLELQGHEVEDAPDGLAGVALVLRLQPDVAFVDVGLPGIDGYEVARRIRADREGRAVCLVALTGYGLPEDQERSRRAGFDAHLVKPFHPAKVSEIRLRIREQT